MILIALAVCLIIGFFVKPKHFPYLMIVYFVFYDMFDGFYKDDKIYSVFRYIVPLTLMFTYCFMYGVLKKLDLIFVTFMGYLFMLWAINAGDPIITARTMLSMILTLMMIPIGKHLSERDFFTLELEKYNRLLLIALPAYIIWANIVGIAGYYTDAFSTGYLITSRMYIVPMVVFLGFHYAMTNKDRHWMMKTVDIGAILVNICIMLLNTRRTALGMLLGGIFIYTYFNRQLVVKMVMLVFALIMALILAYPLYEARLTAQLEKRERIQNLDTYGEEPRALETLYIIDYHERNRDLAQLLFGIKLWDSYDFGVKYFGRDRPIHSDINMMLFSIGLFGELLFFSMVQFYFFRRNSRMHPYNKMLFYPFLAMLFMILLPGRFIGTLTFAPFLILLLTTLKYEAQPLPEPEEEEEAEAEVQAPLALASPA
ncbi:hypothetical protein V9K67_03575 [Paraflavisolibacter sp. H34]|uniref:hypothetical protein n=1 Tax=Huijunlia imazamoxiresistens TaxID=3127457 RepID=UPI00301AB825